MPVYIDGLLSAGAYVPMRPVFLPRSGVRRGRGMSMSWSEDNGTPTLSPSRRVLTGQQGRLVLEADGRYICAGRLARQGDVLYLPGDTIERLFGIRGSVSPLPGWAFD